MAIATKAPGKEATSFNVRGESKPDVKGEHRKKGALETLGMMLTWLFCHFTLPASSKLSASVYMQMWQSCLHKAGCPSTCLPPLTVEAVGVIWRLQESLAPSYPKRRRPGGAAAQIGNHLVWVDWILAADAKRKLQRHPGRPVVNLLSDPDLWHWIYFARKRRSWFILNLCWSLSGKASDTLQHFGGKT